LTKSIEDVFKPIRDGLSYEGKLYAVCVAVLWREFDADVTQGLDGRKGYRKSAGMFPITFSHPRLAKIGVS
jgi:hypothetical protein